LLSSFNGSYSELVDGLPTIRAYNKVENLFTNFQNRMSILFYASFTRIVIDAKILLNILLMTNILEIFKILSLVYLEEPFK
jgi:hypothetical protein